MSPLDNNETNWLGDTVRTLGNEKLVLRPRASKFKKFLLVLAIGVLIGCLSKGYFFIAQRYQAQSQIHISGVGEDRLENILRSHLQAIQNSKFIKPLIADGSASVFIADDHNITLLVSDTKEQKAYDLVNQLTQNYLKDAQAKKAVLVKQLNTNQAKLLREFEEGQLVRSKLTTQIADVTNELSEKNMDVYFADMTSTLKSRITESNELLQTMTGINRDINHYRMQILKPTIILDQQRLEKLELTDARYSGDLRLLTNKHARYLNHFKPELHDAKISLGNLKTSLDAITKTLAKQLQLQLPDTLSDDLFELNLAVEKYETQASHLHERLERYEAKLMLMLEEPKSADFEASQTLLSQLRQDILQRLSPMPTHLYNLFEQISKQNHVEGKQRKLSTLAARNIASSSITSELADVFESWRELNFHINRLFPDGNVELLTLGRICRSLQTRLRYRDEQLTRQLEAKMIQEKKNYAHAQLSKLQQNFEATSKDLVTAFNAFAADEEQITQATQRWPSWRKLTDSLKKINTRMADIESQLNQYTEGKFQPERLSASSIITRRVSRDGLTPSQEMQWTILFALIAMAFTTIIFILNALYYK